MAYKIYITDALKLITENTAKFAGGSYMSVRFDDVIDPPKPVPEDPRSCLEIATEIFHRAKGGDE